MSLDKVPKKIRIVHIISGLGSGGAENMLYKILKQSNAEIFHHEVVSLLDEGNLGDKIRDLGIKVHTLNLNYLNLMRSVIKIRHIAKDCDLIDTWLYHADLIGLIVGKSLRDKKIIWNIRHSNLDNNANKKSTLRIVKLNQKLSRFIDMVVYNSNKAYCEHQIIGYNNSSYRVIPNGFELDRFYFNKESREKIRHELLINDQTFACITVGRWNIQKDYPTLLRALSIVKKQTNQFRMLMVGTNLVKDNIDLFKIVEKYGLKEEVILLGKREDIPALLSAADLYISSSLGESFSNSIGEAMACELHTLVTDAGDSKQIVGGTGQVVKIGDHKQMAGELLSILAKKNMSRNEAARIKVIDNYDIKAVSEEYFNNYINMVR